MAKDKAYKQAEKKIVNNHPRIKSFTNARIRNVAIRVFVAPFVDGLSPKGG